MRLNNLLVATFVLCISTAASAAQNQIVVKARVVDSETHAVSPAIPVKVGYWGCVLLIGCKLHPMTEGITDAEGNIQLTVERRKGIYVSLVMCPGDRYHSGAQLTEDDIKQDTVELTLEVHVAACQREVEAHERREGKSSALSK